METNEVNKETKKIFDELIAKSNELFEKLNKIEVDKALRNQEVIFHNKKITKTGSGSHIFLPKEYIGKTATIIIKKKEGGDKQ